MHIIITDAKTARCVTMQITFFKVVVIVLGFIFLVGLVSVATYRWTVAKEGSLGWGQSEDLSGQEQYFRANLNSMAERLGEMQVKVLQLESLGERLRSLAGLPAPEFKNVESGKGGIFIPGHPTHIHELHSAMENLEQATNQRLDWMTVLETRLFEQYIQKKMIPTQPPVLDKGVGSPFGWRSDPITGQSALHTGLDFQATTGTPIYAAAGGVVIVQEYHPAYGNMVEIDHGNNIVTRYAHASKTVVQRGDLIKRGQKIAEVGTTGRSTGPHLHFEVLVNGVFQDPQKFLSMHDTSQKFGVLQ
jgi:murein DD-endopeptidase MepM/ murein hydrolase activator NlpD